MIPGAESDAVPVGDAVIIVNPPPVAVAPVPTPAPPSVASIIADDDGWVEVVLVDVLLKFVELGVRGERLDVAVLKPDAGTGVGEAITITVPLLVVVEKLHEVLMLAVEFCTGTMGLEMKEVIVASDGVAVAEKLLLLLLMPPALVIVLDLLLVMKLLLPTLVFTAALLGLELALKNGVDSELGCDSAGEGGGVELKTI